MSSIKLRKKSMDKLQEYFNQLEFKPKNINLYILAFTHPSYNADAKTKHHDYERLEYIGDAVIGFVVADLIYKIHPHMDQGLMSKLRSNIVRSSSLAEYARKLNYASYIRTGQSIQHDQINRSNKILEDVFEASVGAIYLDQGINVAYKFIKNIVDKDIHNVDIYELTDAKTRLQEEMQAAHQDRVSYELISTEGPAHNRSFTVNVVFNGVVLATGKGKSIKAAEEDAARQALNKRSI